MKMADNHIRLESSLWPDPLSQANLRVETNRRGEERSQDGRRDRRCCRLGSAFEHPSSRVLHLQFLSSLYFSSSLRSLFFRTSAFIVFHSPPPPLLFFLLPFILLLSTLFLSGPYIHTLCSPLSRVFPNSILNLNHDFTDFTTLCSLLPSQVPRLWACSHYELPNYKGSRI